LTYQDTKYYLSEVSPLKKVEISGIWDLMFLATFSLLENTLPGSAIRIKPFDSNREKN